MSLLIPARPTKLPIGIVAALMAFLALAAQAAKADTFLYAYSGGGPLNGIIAYTQGEGFTGTSLTEEAMLVSDDLSFVNDVNGDGSLYDDGVFHFEFAIPLATGPTIDPIASGFDYLADAPVEGLFVLVKDIAGQATPESSTTCMAALGGAILLMAIRRKQRLAVVPSRRGNESPNRP